MTATSEDLVFTLLGPDRPGIVKEISALVREHGGNWLESSLSHLAGHFAGLVRVTVSAERRGALLELSQVLRHRVSRSWSRIRLAQCSTKERVLRSSLPPMTVQV